MRIKEYDKECAEIDSKITLDVEKAWQEIQKEADKINTKSEKEAKDFNEAPCTVCQKTEYIIKYREVVGTVKGRISGYFSLFGGSISGYIDGETHTNPVLSCRNCENEKLVRIGEYKSSYELLKEQMPWHIYSYHKASNWLCEKGMEVAVGLTKHSGYLEDNSDPRQMSEDTLKKCGLDRKYHYPEKPLLYTLRKFFGLN